MMARLHGTRLERRPPSSRRRAAARRPVHGRFVRSLRLRWIGIRTPRAFAQWLFAADTDTQERRGWESARGPAPPWLRRAATSTLWAAVSRLFRATISARNLAIL